MNRSLFILFVAMAVAGCGNTYRPNVIRAKEISALTAQAYTANGLNESDRNVQTFTCPSQANVVPDYDWEFNGTGFYTVCPSKLNLSDILVHGNSHLGGAVCVFPVQIASNGAVFAKPDVNKADGSAWVQCATPDVDGIHLSFPGISWNAAFIVDAVDVKQMNLCIQGGIYSCCPKHYAFGSFRQ